ncbi:MAG: amidohydrolase family protein [Chloroflexota bacterium]
MKIIDLETHFLTKNFVERLQESRGLPRMEITEADGRKQHFIRYGPSWTQSIEWVFDSLLDLEETRLKEMDNAGIATQVLSLSLPGCELLEPEEGTARAREVNDEIAALCGRHPGRFIGLAALAPQAPEAAARELERAVKKLGFRGACINSHVRGGEYLDEEKYRVLWECAAALDVPVWLHPKAPSPQMIEPFQVYEGVLLGGALGFAAEVTLHVMRLIWSGLFDRFPNLKIVLGHMGEALPFWLPRLDGAKDVRAHPPISLRPSDYIKRNFAITVSGMPFTPAFLCAYLALGAERIMFASDYPYGKTPRMVRFMEDAPICDEDREKILYANAARLLKLD